MNTRMLTLKPSSPGFSGSKSQRAVQHGLFVIGVLAGDLIGDGKGDAMKNTRDELRNSVKRVIKFT